MRLLLQTQSIAEKRIGRAFSVHTFAGFLGFLMSMKFFKYFSISRRMSTLWLTLARASQALLANTPKLASWWAGFSTRASMKDTEPKFG